MPMILPSRVVMPADSADAPAGGRGGVTVAGAALAMLHGAPLRDTPVGPGSADDSVSSRTAPKEAVPPRAGMV
jgi:hypothetical protein